MSNQTRFYVFLAQCIDQEFDANALDEQHPAVRGFFIKSLFWQYARGEL